MRCCSRYLFAISFGLAALAVAGTSLSSDGRFDGRTVPDPEWGVGASPGLPERLEAFDARRAAWNVFRAEHGDWKVHVDTRTGAPLLAEGAGIRFASNVPDQPLRAQLKARALEFVGTHRDAFSIDPAELVFDEKSGSSDGHHWQLVFHREIQGIPVEGESLLFFVNFGKLVSFGATRWGVIEAVPEVRVTEDSARERLYRHMGLTPDDRPEFRQPTRLVLVAAPPPGASGHYMGRVGEGVRYRLAWRFLVAVPPDSGLWSAAVDATTGEVISFFDTAMSNQVKGGVYGFSNDDDCPEGCQQPGRPMPYADVKPDGQSTLYADDLGAFSCGAAGEIETTLVGDHDPQSTHPTVKMIEACPAGTSETADDCGQDIDLGAAGGTDCNYTGTSAAARTSYYHTNRILEKARGWWPTMPWAQALRIDVRPNLASETCNGKFTLAPGPTIKLGLSSSSCRNSGETPGVIHHEAGHAIDYQDGGAENSYEGTADTYTIIQGRTSCIGQGLRHSPCPVFYAYSCNECTGFREMDNEKRAPTTRATVAWLVDRLGVPEPPYTFSTPCHFQHHWEGHILAETVYDLAAKDLPAMGLDEDSAWQLTEKLFYMTRGAASVGNAYSCGEDEWGTLQTSGCLSSSWFKRFLAADDDGDGTANGTPHAAAIFAAFDRHGIACGGSKDPKNQNKSACTTSIGAPVLTVTWTPDSRILNWTAVPFATEYLVTRNDLGCGYSFNVIARTSVTTYVDLDVPEDQEAYYRVQATTTAPLTTGDCPAALEYDCGGPDCAPRSGAAYPRVPTGMGSCFDRITETDLICEPGEEIYIETTDCRATIPGPPYPVCASSTSKVKCSPTQLCESQVSNCAPACDDTETCPVSLGMDCGDGCTLAFPPGTGCTEVPYGGGGCNDGASGGTVCCPEDTELYIKTCECEAIGVKPPPGGLVPVCPTSVSTMVCR